MFKQLRSFIYFFILAVFAAGFFWIFPTAATAVDDATKITEATDYAGQTSTQKMELPVSWQMTRARIIAADASTDSENFFETWMLERTEAGIFYLTSSRARVAVTVKSKNDVWLKPNKILLSQKNFADLIGIQLVKDDAETLAMDSLPVEIDFQLEDRNSEMVINISEDERLSIVFSIGRPNLNY